MDLDKLKTILTLKIDSNSGWREAHLSHLLELAVPLLEARCTAQAKWYTERDRLRHPKDLKQFTDLDRTIMLESAVAEYQREYNELKGLEDLLNQRIQVIISLGN